MGTPLMIQPADAKRIDRLRRALGIKTKVAVLRSGLDLLEREAERRSRIGRWRRAVGLVAATSAAVNLEFQPHARLRRAPE